MKVKKVFKGIALGAAMSLMVATGAQAAKEANMFGASAQWIFWSNSAVDFLKNGLGCPDDAIVSAAGSVTQATHGFSSRNSGFWACKGAENIDGLGTGGGIGTRTGWTGSLPAGFTAGETVVIRYATMASSEGIKAVKNDDSSMGECNSLFPAGGYRGFATTGTGSTISTVTCKKVHGGASDVGAATFNFRATGLAEGPCGGANQVDRGEDSLSVPTSYTTYTPLAVPFAFFANTSVPFNNISRSQAILLFTGQVPNWNFFKADLNGNGVAGETATYPAGDSLRVTSCMRFGDSGTQATFLASVIRGDSAVPNTAKTTGEPRRYFHTGSSQLLKCLSGCGGTSTWTGAGAIGILDADQAAAPTNATDGMLATGTTNVKRLTYQGFTATAENISNGSYDFWGAQHLYVNPAIDAGSQNLVGQLVAFAGNPANMPTSRAAFWAALDGMQVKKVNDFAMPQKK